jgi:hypothetical protein
MRYMSVAREQPPVERIVRPFQDFAHKQSSGGVLLIAVTAVALVWANSPWSDSYFALWDSKLTVGVGDFTLSKDLTHWINDGLMAVFFLVVGLEIKREVLVGELSSIRGATLPVVAQRVQRALDSRQQRAEPHAKSGPGVQPAGPSAAGPANRPAATGALNGTGLHPHPPPPCGRSPPVAPELMREHCAAHPATGRQARRQTAE